MSDPVSCYYVVKAYEIININTPPSTSDPEGTSGGWIPITTSGKQVNLTHKVKYTIQVFKTGTTTPALKDSQGVNIAGQAGSAFVVWRDANASSFSVNGIDTTHYGDTFTFTVTGKLASSVAPKFKVQLLPNTELNPSPNYSEVPIKSGTSIPVVQLTKAKTVPNTPKEVLNDTNNEGFNGSKYYAWNSCVQQWVSVSYVQATSNGKSGYNVTIRYRDANGNLKNTQALGFEAATDTKFPKSAKAREAILTAYQCVEAATNEGPTDLLPGTSKPVDISKNRTNPPNHIVTRDIGLMRKIGANLVKSGASVADAMLLEDSNNKGRLGMIFQDKDSAAALNDPKDPDPWGFRFIYNPTSFQYNTNIDASIDWMLAAKDPANYVGGNTNVSFQLYLNRIADMTELRKLKNTTTASYGTNYPRPLSQEEIQGLIYRGTEYDLEFLYRVVNGSPKASNNGLLTYKSGGKDAMTADFGYITGTPIWVRLHDNLRYKGSIASISVNHVMFTEEMIPMFSLVDISMVRYPVIGDVPSDVANEYQKKAAKAAAGGGADAAQGGTTNP